MARNAPKQAVDWDLIWSHSVQQIRPSDLVAANDNDAQEREPSNFGLVVVLIAIVGIGMACIGAIR